SNVSALRYGFELDKSCFIDIGMNAQLVLSLFNIFVSHPFPLFIVVKNTAKMNKVIRRGYIATHMALIIYEVVFFFFARIYTILPFSGLYCEGPLCRMGLPTSIVLGIISFPIVLLQPPFAFLIMSMHQLFVPDNSPFKLSMRIKIALASLQLTMMSLNIVGFIIFGREPDNADELYKEPELVFLAQRGGLILLFRGPGRPQYFRYVLLFFMLHTMISIKTTSAVSAGMRESHNGLFQAAKSAQTQVLLQKMFDVFFWQITNKKCQLHGSILNHSMPLVALMIFLFSDASDFPGVLLATLKLALLILFTLNSAQFSAIFIFKNSANRKVRI
ncbi:hypothetical protein PENTCL1PPCAC_14699, partial [Pristionchus entomophagus]